MADLTREEQTALDWLRSVEWADFGGPKLDCIAHRNGVKASASKPCWQSLISKDLIEAKRVDGKMRLYPKEA